MNTLPSITVIIKTFNEQAGIAATIQSIKKQLSGYEHSVIVADSLSTDNTQQIALDNGAKVASLIEEQDRCCGVGHQLGYLHSDGDYLLLMDGDMTLGEGFIDKAVAFLDSNPNYAGVAGTVEMDEASSYEFKSRKQRLHKIYPLGDCSHLGGGGMYRKSAIDEIGYLTHRTLHAYEEAELGMRLKHAGYKLHRLDTPFFLHTSYDMPTLQLLKYRWKSRYLFAPGELLKSAFGKAHFKDALSTVRNELIFACYLLGVISMGLFAPTIVFLLSLAPLGAFFTLKAIKNRSVKDACLSVLNLSVFAAGLVRGLFSPTKNPTVPPKNRLIE